MDKKNIIKIVTVAVAVSGVALVAFLIFNVFSKTKQSSLIKEENLKVRLADKRMLEGDFSGAVDIYEKTLQKRRESNLFPINRRGEIQVRLAIAEFNSGREADAIGWFKRIIFGSNYTNQQRAFAAGRLAEVSFLLPQKEVLSEVISNDERMEKIVHGSDAYETYASLLTYSDILSYPTPVGYRLVSYYAEKLNSKEVGAVSGVQDREVAKKILLDKLVKIDKLFANADKVNYSPDQLFISKIYRAKAINDMYQAGMDLTPAGILGREEAGKIFEEALAMKNDKWISVHPERYEYLGRLYHAIYLMESGNGGEGNSKIKEVLDPVYQKRIDSKLSIYNFLQNKNERRGDFHDAVEIEELGKADPEFGKLLVDLGWEI